MELIIKISDKMFDTFKEHGIMAFDNLDEYNKDILADIIANGTPLPKGHGDLIDRSEVTKKGVCTYRWWSTGEDENAYPAEWVDDAEVVIPADKESDNETAN